VVFTLDKFCPKNAHTGLPYLKLQSITSILKNVTEHNNALETLTPSQAIQAWHF
jgi:hypothetical protein